MVRRFLAIAFLAVVFIGGAMMFTVPAAHADAASTPTLHCSVTNHVMTCWKYAPPAPHVVHHRPAYLVAYAPLQHKFVRYHFKKHYHVRRTAKSIRYWRWYFFYGPGRGH